MEYLYANHREDMILRDYLAYDRTKFALMRTFLSIARTALGLYASGVGLVILRSDHVTSVLGWLIIVVATLVLVAGGIYSYRAKKRLDGLGRGPLAGA